ncbi:hypothetical protein D3C87_1925260 [compost metagenome]
MKTTPPTVPGMVVRNSKPPRSCSAAARTRALVAQPAWARTVSPSIETAPMAPARRITSPSKPSSAINKLLPLPRTKTAWPSARAQARASWRAPTESGSKK